MDNVDNTPKHDLHVVRDSNVGVYMWMLPNGNFLANKEGLPLNVGPAIEGDIRAIIELNNAAKYWGFPDGEAVFIEAHRCTEEEYQEQVADLNAGKLPIARVRR